MDLDELREFLSTSKVDVWSLIDSAITVASLDYGDELKDRRDGIVQNLYFPPSSGELCRSCRGPVEEKPPQPQQQKQKEQVEERTKSPLTPESNHQTDDDYEDGGSDPFVSLFDDEQEKIRHIREQLEDPGQDEQRLVDLLQNLVDMDITFKALQETDIGRVVSGFRKQHPCTEVRRLSKSLVRNWKETVDEWVSLNQPEQAVVSSLTAEGDSPQHNVQTKNHQNGHYQASDSSYSPNPQNWGSGSEKNYAESQPRAKAVSSREAPSRPPQSAQVAKSSSVPPPNRQKESSIDLEKLNSAGRRLQESYQEAQNAKRQRTIQVMDLHDLPKPKNTFFAKNKGGFQGRNHR